MGSCGFLVNRLSCGLWLQSCGYLCFSGFPFLIIRPRDKGFAHGLHPLTFPVVGSPGPWPEMTEGAPQDPLSHMVVCSESRSALHPHRLVLECVRCLCFPAWDMEGKLVHCTLSAAGLCSSLSSAEVSRHPSSCYGSLRARPPRYLQIRLCFPFHKLGPSCTWSRDTRKRGSHSGPFGHGYLSLLTISPSMAETTCSCNKLLAYASLSQCPLLHM